MNPNMNPNTQISREITTCSQGVQSAILIITLSSRTTIFQTRHASAANEAQATHESSHLEEVRR
jgi:hypothetical protein